MKRFAFALLFAAVTGSSFGQLGWTRYRLFPSTPSEAQRINDSALGMFSDEVSLGETDVIVAPGQLPELARVGLPGRWISNLPDPRNWARNHPGGFVDNYQTEYLRYDTIIAQYEAWRTAFPNLVSRQSIGTSWNGRTVWAYRYMPPTGSRTASQCLVTICGIHAREWISPSVGMYIMDMLIQSSFTRSGFAARVPSGTAFYIIPVLNPDGYEYCWTNNRMWRKNRRNNGGGVYGVDLNRNFAKGFGGSGSSGSPSSETYRGPSAFSEPETNGLRTFLQSVPNPAGFLDLHSYGQLVLWPWAYTTTLAPGDPWLRPTGLAMKQGILTAGGLSYGAGPSSTTLYISSGSSKDYVYDVYNSASYSIELRDTGVNGFLLPENQILPTQIETWAGFQEFAARILNR